VWNYLNDRFYSMMRSQLFYGASEGVMSLLLVPLCHADTPLHPTALWTILSIAGVHALRNRMDQSSPLFGVFLMGVVDWAIVAVMAVALYCAVGTQHARLRDVAAHAVESVRGAVARLTGGEAASVRVAPTVAAHTDVLAVTVTTNGAATAGKASPVVVLPTYVYTRSMAMKDAAIAGGAIALALVLLPLTGWF